MDVDKAWVSVCVSQHVYGMPMCKIGGFVCIDSWGMCIQVAFPGARAPPASCRDEDGLSSPGSLTIKGGVFVLHFSTGSYTMRPDKRLPPRGEDAHSESTHVLTKGLL